MNHHHARMEIQHALLIVVAVVAVSCSAILIKLSTAPAAIIGMYRLVLTCVLLTPVFLRHVNQLRALQPRDWALTIISGVFLGLHFLFWIESLKLTSVASSMILLSLQPIFVLIGAFFLFAERTSMKAVISMLAAVCGSAIIAIGDSAGPSGSLIGDLMSVLGTLAISAYMLTGQRLRTNISSTVYNFLVFFVAAVVLLVFNVGTQTPLLHYNLSNWTLFFLLALIPTLFGHALLNWLLKFVPATVLSMSILAEPIGAICLAVLLLHESLDGVQVIGGIFTLASVWMFLWFRRRGHYTTNNLDC